MIESSLPKHVAIIMDGNGRWAKRRGLPRVAGHKAGMNNLKTIALAANDLHIKALTVYAFSTENWRRPQQEVQFLMNLPVDFFGSFMPDIQAHNVRILITGFWQQLPSKTRQVCQRAVAETAANTGMILNFAFNYGGRSDILQAVQRLCQDCQNQTLSPDKISEATFARYLKSAQLQDLQDPDLLIRTSGEERMSNFYLWELAYAELVFVPEMWPDYSPTNLQRDLQVFQHRNRRFGGL